MEETFDAVVAPITAALVILIDNERIVQELVQLYLGTIPNFETLVLDKANQSANSMPSCCLILGLCFVQDQLKGHL